MFELQELPKRISTSEEKEILSLLCKVHELEIDKVRKAKFSGAVVTFLYLRLK